jgi:hypothetical protein
MSLVIKPVALKWELPGQNHWTAARQNPWPAANHRQNLSHIYSL